MVVFKQKINVKPKDKVVKKLGDFILKNKVFFDIFCEIIIRCSKIEDFSKEFLDTLFLINPLIDKTSDKTYEFIDKITKFYDTTNKSLSKRRGDVVEYLFEEIVPQTDTKEAFIKETEFYIYYDGSKLGASNHDIDLGVYCEVENFIELYECKVRLQTFLFDRPPLERTSRRKLDYLKRVYQEITSVSNKNIFLVCLELNVVNYRYVLDKYNYKIINLIDRNSIEKLMFKNGQALC